MEKRRILSAWYLLQKLKPDEYKVRYVDGELRCYINHLSHSDYKRGFRRRFTRVDPITMLLV